ncbi:MAG: metallophosphoesterase [Candidatus Brocadiia bacterium]|nr:metallophosphoesterase [Candidatus Brocadiia bacterium]
MSKFRAEQIELAHGALAAGAAPVAFAHLSDLHLGRWGPRQEHLVETVARHDPDFVFVTGDVFHRHPHSLDCAARLFSQLRAPRGVLTRGVFTRGVFMVRGNWDVCYGPPVRRLRGLLADWGADLLVNEGRIVQSAAGRVRIIGVDDPALGCPDFAAALASGGPGPAFTVLLCHGPVGAYMLPQGHGVDLMLAGHTHGGQVRVPFWRRMPYRFYGGLTHGLHEVNSLRVYVSRGFGAVGKVRVRFRCPAEVTFFRVHGPRARRRGAGGDETREDSAGWR